MLFITVIAILFLGPDKLPKALVDMAKFIKDVKKTISDAKGSLEEEMKISDLKEEALNYKKQLTDATAELKGFKNLSFDDFDDDTSYDEEVSTESPQSIVNQSKKKDPKKVVTQDVATEESLATQVEPKNDTVTLKKKPKEKIAKNDETKNSKGDA